MQGHPDVIDYLNTLLTGELAARDQYFIHSRMYEDWGFTHLYERINHEMEEEAQHADALMRRILMLEGTPRMRPDDLDVGTSVPTMLESDLRLEYKVRDALRKGIELCERHNDYVTREILRVQLNDTEEDHTYWLEKQLGLIKAIGLQNYLQSQAQGL
ncbi:bacterioferritin [Pseudomonas sp. NPDC007930]|uniref:bacterioferritin n=1 Tax=Pseudomonas sp. NPDC007930 TaxID=3364417 RepID=UPI0036E8800D